MKGFFDVIIANILSIFLSIFIICIANGCASVNSSRYVLIPTSECVQINEEQVDFNLLGTVKNERIVVYKDVDLNGKVCHLPDNYTIEFKGAIIRNGTLIGNNSRIVCSRAAFDDISIKGTWIIPEISSSLFLNPGKENALKNLFALTNPLVKNRVTIEKGDYYLSISSNWGCGVLVCSNTEVIIHGTINLNPNALIGSDIIRITGENIIIKGDGQIIGDRNEHLGDKGEWGMGINIQGASNVVIQGITVRDCWGDCVYIGEKSNNILITKSRIERGRRQGISITSADGVTISKCLISDVYGVDPECAIDAEPNEKDTVANVYIHDVVINNCKGGILGYGKALGSQLGNIVVRNNRISTTGKSTVCIIGAESVRVEKNSLYQTVRDKVVTLREIGEVTITNNKLYSFDNAFSMTTITQCKRLLSRRNKEYILCNIPH